MDFKINNNFDLSSVKKYTKNLIEQIYYKYDDKIYSQNDPSPTDSVKEYLEAENLKASQNFQDTQIEMASNAAMAVGGFANGVGNFGENVVDAGVTVGAAVATPFTWLYDQVTGSNVTEEMWNNSNAFVAEEHVNNAFEDFYTNNEIGKAINENASEVMQYGNAGYNTAVGVGYLTATVASAGTVSQVSALGMVTSGAAISGTAGFGRGTSDALNAGATTQEALIAGGLTGLWEGGQWVFGAKIAGKGFTTVALDVGSGAVDPLVRSGIQTIYNDQSFADTFEQNGGVEAMIGNAAVAGGFSGLGEVSTFKGGTTTKANASSDIDLKTSKLGNVSNSENTSYWIQNGDSVSPSPAVFDDYLNTVTHTEEARIFVRQTLDTSIIQKMQINSNTAKTFESLYSNPNVEVGIHKVGYASKENINDILENGLIMTEDSMSGGAMPSTNKIPQLDNNVSKQLTLYQCLLKTLEDYKGRGSRSEIIIAIPAGIKENDPSLYFWDNSIGYWRLKPEYIVGYVPVDYTSKFVGEITKHLD